MATISGVVTIGSSPGAAPVLLLNSAGDTVVASVDSDPTTGAYEFTGLAAATVFRVLVMGQGVHRSRAYGPCSTP